MAWSDAPYIAATGFAMGTADVVPGVSGGTIAVAMGVYQRLLAAITSIGTEAITALLRLRLARVFELVHWRFLGTLGAGLAMAIGVMVKVFKLPYLVEHQPKLVYSVFFGLVLASAFVLARRIPRWDGAKAVALAAGAGAGLAVVNLVPVTTPETGWMVFLSGFVAICAMVLPGISGSFVLLILGKYAYVLNALGSLQLGILLPFGAGCLLGITSFSRLVGWALQRFHDPMIAALTGLLLGSLWRIWPYQHLTTVVVRDKPRVIGAQPFLPESAELGVVGLMAAGLSLVLVLEFVASRRAHAQAVS